MNVIPEEERRVVTLKTNTTAEEAARIRRRAARFGGVSNFLRLLALESPAEKEAK